MGTAEHIVKFVELYEGGSLGVDDVEYTEAELPEDDEFDIAIPKYNYVGDLVGEHDFRISVRSFLTTRERMYNNITALQNEYDEFSDLTDRIIAALQDIKNKKKAQKGLTSGQE